MDFEAALREAVSSITRHVDTRVEGIEVLKAFNDVFRDEIKEAFSHLQSDCENSRKMLIRLCSQMDSLSMQVARLSAVINHWNETGHVKATLTEASAASSSKTPTLSYAAASSSKTATFTYAAASRSKTPTVTDATDEDNEVATIKNAFASMRYKPPALTRGSKPPPQSPRKLIEPKAHQIQFQRRKKTGFPVRISDPNMEYTFPELDDIVSLVGNYSGAPHELRAWTGKVDQLWAEHDFYDWDAKDVAYKRALLKALPSCFQGEASVWYNSKGREMLEKAHWQDWKIALKARFGGTFVDIGVRHRSEEAL